MNVKEEDFLQKTATVPAITTWVSGSPESQLSVDRPSMQLLTLPSTARSRSRGCSITSYRSEDALSNHSLGSLIPHDFDVDYLCECLFKSFFF